MEQKGRAVSGQLRGEGWLRAWLCSLHVPARCDAKQTGTGVQRWRRSASLGARVAWPPAQVGPRCTLNPIKMFSGSFGGPVVYENPAYVSPNTVGGRERLSARLGCARALAAGSWRCCPADPNPVGLFAKHPARAAPYLPADPRDAEEGEEQQVPGQGGGEGGAEGARGGQPAAARPAGRRVPVATAARGLAQRGGGGQAGSAQRSLLAAFVPLHARMCWCSSSSCGWCSSVSG